MIPNDIMIAIVTKRAPAALRTHLQLQAFEYGGNYNRCHEIIAAYCRALGATASVGDHAIGIECDYVGTATKGSGKAPPEKTGSCYNCGKEGHYAKECWSGTKGSQQKNQEKQPDKKTEKAKESDTKCFTCGQAGHFARGCRRS